MYAIECMYVQLTAARVAAEQQWMEKRDNNTKLEIKSSSNTPTTPTPKRLGRSHHKRSETGY